MSGGEHPLAGSGRTHTPAVIPGLTRDPASFSSRREAGPRLKAGATTYKACTRPDGFTLIETLVALSVFALAAVALLRLQGATLSSTARLQEQLLAQIVARNVAILAMTDPVAPTRGEASGEEENGGRDWRWTRTVGAAGDESVIRIDVAVADADGRPAARLAMYRAAR